MVTIAWMAKMRKKQKFATRRNRAVSAAAPADLSRVRSVQDLFQKFGLKGEIPCDQVQLVRMEIFEWIR